MHQITRHAELATYGVIIARFAVKAARRLCPDPGKTRRAPDIPLFHLLAVFRTYDGDIFVRLCSVTPDGYPGLSNNLDIIADRLLTGLQPVSGAYSGLAVKPSDNCPGHVVPLSSDKAREFIPRSAAKRLTHFLGTIVPSGSMV